MRDHHRRCDVGAEEILLSDTALHLKGLQFPAGLVSTCATLLDIKERCDPTTPLPR